MARTLRDYRGQRMVLLVLYGLPQSRTRMAEVGRRYGALSVPLAIVADDALERAARAIPELSFPKGAV